MDQDYVHHPYHVLYHNLVLDYDHLQIDEHQVMDYLVSYLVLQVIVYVVVLY